MTARCTLALAGLVLAAQLLLASAAAAASTQMVDDSGSLPYDAPFRLTWRSIAPRHGVPDNMLVGKEGDGWKQVTTELAFERSGPERYLSSIQLVIELIREMGREPGERAAATVGRNDAGRCSCFQVRWRMVRSDRRRPHTAV